MLSGGDAPTTAEFQAPLSRGGVRLGLSTEYHAFTRPVHGDDYVTYEELVENWPATESHHNSKLYSWQADFSLRYALRDRTELFAVLPLRRLRVEVAEETNHHRNETIEGLGDMQLGVRRFVRAEQYLRVGAILGMSLPTGEKKSLPTAAYLGSHVAEALGIDVPPHSHLRLGSGTVNPFVAVDGVYSPEGDWIYMGSMSVTVPFYDASDGYRTATSGSVTLGLGRRVQDEDLSINMFASVSYSGRDEFHGDPVTGTLGTHDGNLDVTNTGRFEVTLRPTLGYRFSDSLSLDFQLTVPVYTRIHEDVDQRDVQLSERVGVVASLSYQI
ncbi:MAG: hypothetical protein HRT46_10410 [Deltaproteobacteria bacterium]|nr:hypothetical protein [Deltaproteobacteria bacterium]